MLKISFALIYAVLAIWGLSFLSSDHFTHENKQYLKIDTLSNASAWPNDALEVKNFVSADISPSPACLAVAATGEVFVGIDQNKMAI